MNLLNLFEDSNTPGLNYAEELAYQIFKAAPDLDATGAADEVLDYAFDLAVNDLGRKRAHSLFAYDEDFDGDLVTAYVDLQMNKSAEDRKQAGHDRLATGTNEGVAKGSLNEFAPGGNSASSYYAVTANFVSEFSQQKEEEIQDLIAAGWTKQDLAQAGTLQGQAADIAHFEQVRDGFLKGLKPGFDAYLQGDTQMKDQLGEYWLDNDLPLNQDWEKIYGEPWGEDIDEGWKDKLAAGALAATMAVGAGAANARVIPGQDVDPGINRLTGKPIATQVQKTNTANASSGYSKEYLQSIVNGTHPRPMISVEKAQELLNQMNEGEVYDLEKEYGYEKPKAQPKRASVPPTRPSLHPEDTDFMDPIERRLRADQARVKAAWAAHNAKKDTNESRMSELDAEYQDYKKLSPREFYNMYRITKQAWLAKYKSMLPQQGVAEADKKKDEEPEVKDVALQRAISRAKADFPTAGSGLEALAKGFMQGQDEDQKSFDQIRQAERRQDQMLAQISKIDQEQEQEIQGLEQQNSTLADRLQQLQSVNSELEKKLAAMSGRRAEKKSKKDSAPTVAPVATTEPITPVTKKAAKTKAKAQPAKPSNRLATKKIPATTPGARAFLQMTPALSDNPQASLFPSDYGQDSANMALQQLKKDALASKNARAQDVDFRDVADTDALRKIAQQELSVQENNEKEVDYDDPRWDAMVKRVGQKAREQEKNKPVDIADLARRLAAIDASRKEK